jgi:hypothetical protein
VSDEHYKPAKRPPGPIPGGNRVRFENEGGVEQGIFGGSGASIAKSIMDDTRINTRIIGQKIVGVSTTKGDLGSGTLQEMVIRLANGTSIYINGIGLEVHVNDE